MSAPPRNPSDTPIQQAIKKRKTQEVARQADARRTTQAQPQAPVTTSPAVVPESASKRTPQAKAHGAPPLLSTHQGRLIGIGVLIVCTLMCMGSALIAVRQAAQAAPTVTFVPLPLVSASDVLKYWRTLGLSTLNVQKLSVPNKTWHAAEGIRAELQRNSAKGSVLLLSYPSMKEVGADAYLTSSGGSFKQWTVVQAANVLLLTSPDMTPALSSELASHLTQQLVAPYRLFLPTVTPVGIPNP